MYVSMVVQCLVLLGCCYHKIGHAQWTPMSQQIQHLSQKYSGFSVGDTGTDKSGCGFLTTYGLRLAAQETKDR